MTPAEKQAAIQNVADKIAKRFKPKKIILFGSYAYGQPRQDSDVDLMVVTETDDILATGREIDGSIFPRPFPIDILVYRPDRLEHREKLGDSFAREVLTRGKVLYAR